MWHPLVPIPKKHLLLIKNKLLPFKTQLIFCLIIAAVYGSQLKHTHAAANLTLYNSEVEQRSYNMSAVAFSFYSMSHCLKCTRLWSSKLSYPSVLQADQTGWDISFPCVFPLIASEINFRTQILVPVTSRQTSTATNSSRNCCLLAEIWHISSSAQHNATYRCCVDFLTTRTVEKWFLSRVLM